MRSILAGYLYHSIVSTIVIHVFTFVNVCMSANVNHIFTYVFSLWIIIVNIKTIYLFSFIKTSLLLYHIFTSLLYQCLEWDSLHRKNGEHV